MRPAKYDLALYRGDSYTWQFRLWTDEAHELPEDLTGVTVKAEMRNASGGTTIVSLPCAVVGFNVIEMSLPASTWDTMSASPKVTVWDLQLTYPDASVFTAMAGNVTITMDVTDSTTALLRRPRR
jgi:hypothetical protein